MNTVELLMSAQTVVMTATGAVLVWYTIETKRLRVAAAAKFEIMRRTHSLQIEEIKRAAEPIFVWGNGSSNADDAEWEFINEGGPISNLNVTIQSPTGTPTGVQATIQPTEWLGTSRHGRVKFHGAVRQQFQFTIDFRTRIGSVGGFFFSASNTNRPINTGSGWL
jgi:hypothetical protein